MLGQGSGRRLAYSMSQQESTTDPEDQQDDGNCHNHSDDSCPVTWHCEPPFQHDSAVVERHDWRHSLRRRKDAAETARVPTILPREYLADADRTLGRLSWRLGSVMDVCVPSGR